MNEYWEIYMKQLEGAAASVLANVGLALEDNEFKATYPIVGFVKVALKNPKENGLIDESEEDELSFLEDKLEASMIKFRIGKYAGRIITQGSVTFLYYLQFTYNWQDFLEYALAEFEDFEISAGFQDDSEWNFYHNLLYPNVDEWQIINNHKVCEKLKESGDDLQTPRAIEHRVVFDVSVPKEFIEAIQNEGFRVMEQEDKSVKFYRKDKPFYYDIDAVTLTLIALSKEHGGMYDGWECSVVKIS